MRYPAAPLQIIWRDDNRLRPRVRWLRKQNATRVVLRGMASTSSATLPHSTVAIIEPDVLARMTIAEYLRDCGYRVIEAMNPADIFKLLAAGTVIRTVLCEARVNSDLDGLAFAKAVRERYPHTDVILSVGVANATDKAGTLCEEGPLQKPFHPQELLRRIQRLRERRRLGSQSSPV
jgi:DNA-binding NtrC family response regulator